MSELNDDLLSSIARDEAFEAVHGPGELPEPYGPPCYACKWAGEPDSWPDEPHTCGIPNYAPRLVKTEKRR